MDLPDLDPFTIKEMVGMCVMKMEDAIHRAQDELERVQGERIYEAPYLRKQMEIAKRQSEMALALIEKLAPAETKKEVKK